MKDWLFIVRSYAHNGRTRWKGALPRWTGRLPGANLAAKIAEMDLLPAVVRLHLKPCRGAAGASRQRQVNSFSFRGVAVKARERLGPFAHT